MGLSSIVAFGVVLVLLGVVLHQRRRIERLSTRLSDASRTDPLTGLVNRRAFEELLDSELERSRRTGRPLSVVVGDLDGLGELNGRLGFPAGDRVLQRVARDMLKWKRRIDSAGRIGGEEFALLLPETDERGAFLVAERLRRAAHRTFGDDTMPVTVSFGVASYPEHGDRLDLLMGFATHAMGAAKELGKDRSVVYSAEVARMLASVGGPDGAELQLATVIGLAEALDIRDAGSVGHSQTVGRYAQLTAMRLGLPDDRVERVRLAGVLHDVGKIGVSDRVIAKPGPLDSDEWREMRTHPEIGARLLAHPDFDDLRAWVHSHHERPDGGGYPLGLAGDAIPLEASILAVADAYEAMTADRAYRSSLGEEAARAELEAGAGTQFDAGVVRAFLAVLEPGGAARLLRRAS
ncbi:MAG TPA: diguanylate cyclase [Thermoleophilaceae bacterium]|nr:diguanylate cyclase [Thermoleophilaceae bacterium]